jgi:hypothetical protein
MSYFKNVVIGLDQFLNTLLWGFPDETLSSRAYRAERDGRILGKVLRPSIDLLLFLDPKHCYTSYISELERRQLPSNFK